MNFWGGSFVADPYGELLFEASHEKKKCMWKNWISEKSTKRGTLALPS